MVKDCFCHVVGNKILSYVPLIEVKTNQVMHGNLSNDIMEIQESTASFT